MRGLVALVVFISDVHTREEVNILIFFLEIKINCKTNVRHGRPIVCTVV